MRVFLGERRQLPPEYETAYLCDLLNLSYTELAAQPVSWVRKMKVWREAKAAAERKQQERAERRARMRR